MSTTRMAGTTGTNITEVTGMNMAGANITVLDHIPTHIDTEKLAEKLRISDEDDNLADFSQLVEDAKGIARPKGLYTEVYIDEKGEDFIAARGYVFKSTVLRRNLDKVYRFFPYMATCGTELEKWSETVNDPLLRYWADAIKESFLRCALEVLREHFTASVKIERYSSMNPGSLPDWPITEQKKLFSLTGDVEGLIGVRLTESCLMIPVKSISGILFPNETGFDNCQLCQRKNCPGRRAEYIPDSMV